MAREILVTCVESVVTIQWSVTPVSHCVASGFAGRCSCSVGRSMLMMQLANLELFGVVYL
jgi:hypothetical protein